MRLIVKTKADRCYENLLTTNKVAVIIPNKYPEASCQDILLTVRNPAYEWLHFEKVLVTNTAYMLLYYVLLF
jgi:hypothetical protein